MYNGVSAALMLFMTAYRLSHAGSVTYRNTGDGAWILTNPIQANNAYCDTNPCRSVLYATTNELANQQGIVIAAKGGYQVNPYTICGDNQVNFNRNWFECDNPTGSTLYVTASDSSVTATLVKFDGTNVAVPVTQTNGIYDIQLTQPRCTLPAPYEYNDGLWHAMNEPGFDFENPSYSYVSLCDILPDALKGYNAFRFPATWDHCLQTTLTQPVDFTRGCAAAWFNLVVAAAEAGYAVYADPVHNYGRYKDSIIGDPGCDATLRDLYNLGIALGQQLASLPQSTLKNIIVEAMNEPYDMDITQVLSQQNSFVQGLRAAGHRGLALYSWGEYDQARAASRWLSYFNRSSVTDPIQNWGLVSHAYFQDDGSTPEDGQCMTTPLSATELSQLDLIANYSALLNITTHFTEVGSNTQKNCLSQMQSFIHAVQNYQTPDVLLAVAIWATGKFSTDYPLYSGAGSVQQEALLSLYTPDFLYHPSPVSVPTKVSTQAPIPGPTRAPTLRTFAPTSPTPESTFAPTSALKSAGSPNLTLWLSISAATAALLALAAAGYVFCQQQGNMFGFFRPRVARGMYTAVVAESVRVTDNNSDMENDALTALLVPNNI